MALAGCKVARVRLEGGDVYIVLTTNGRDDFILRNFWLILIIFAQNRFELKTLMI